MVSVFTSGYVNTETILHFFTKAWGTLKKVKFNCYRSRCYIKASSLWQVALGLVSVSNWLWNRMQEFV